MILNDKLRSESDVASQDKRERLKAKRAEKQKQKEGEKTTTKEK